MAGAEGNVIGATLGRIWRADLASPRALAGSALRELLWRARSPGPLARWSYRTGSHLLWGARELSEWAWRSLVATPVFLSRCATYGKNVAVDRVPYLDGPCRIELGDQVRFSGLVSIRGARRAPAVLRIGNGVFIGHGASLVVSKQVEIGNFVSIGNGTYIADTDGHSHARPGVPIWEDPATVDGDAAVVIENDVHINRQCIILKGVRIGARSIIGAGSVVRGDIPPDSIVAGNPARVLGWRRGATAPKSPRAAASPAPVGAGAAPEAIAEPALSFAAPQDPTPSPLGARR